MTQTSPTERFSSRVQDYIRYRPSYPAEIISHLAGAGILKPDSIIADVGSGTGLLTELFLRCGNRVFGIEPNADMRAAGEQQLHGYSGFTGINAAAESTTLPDHSIDLISAGQAFHWFDRPPRPRGNSAHSPPLPQSRHGRANLERSHHHHALPRRL